MSRSVLWGKGPLIFVFIVLLFTSILLFAQFEFIDNPVRYEKIIEEGQNPYFEAFYWLITTATTVGYGDYVPLSTEGKILALVVMVIGVSFLGFILTSITQSIVSTNLKEVFGISIAKKRVDYIICGWNELSKAAFSEIQHEKYNIIIIDEAAPPGLLDKNIQYIKGDPKDSDILEKANIKHAKNVILCIDKDSDALLTIHLIRRLNPWVNVVAKINNYEHIKLAEHAGADQVVSPSSIAGRLLSIATEEPFVVRWVLNATTSASEAEFFEHKISKISPLLGKTIEEATTIFHKAKILGMISHEKFERFPQRTQTLHAGDRLLLMAIKKEIHD